MEVSLVIPNYNGKMYLQELLPAAQAQGFSRTFVLDDASTDGSYEWLKQQPDITAVKGEKNLGPTGNRNRILPYIQTGIIVFLDADMEFLTNQTAEKVNRQFMAFPDMAVLGALIQSPQDEPMWYNWGYESSPKRDGINEALQTVALAHWDNPEVMETVRKAAKGWVGHFEPLVDREADWVSEAFFAVRADIFQELQGFDTNFIRFHEGPDYCKRAQALGKTIRFTTGIQVKHLDMHTGDESDRAALLRHSTKYWYQKHYNVPDTIIERFFLW